MDPSQLPPEYQAEAQALMQRRALAQALAQRALTPQQTEMVGNRAVKRSPLSFLAQALTGYLGNKQASQAGQDLQGVFSRYGTDSRSELERLQGMPEPEAIKAGQVSKFPSAQAMAKALLESRQKRAEKGATVLGEAGQTDRALQTLNTGEVPAGGSANAFTQPRVDWIKSPEGQSVAQTTNYDKYGRPTIALGSQGTNVINQLPGKEVDTALDTLKADLKERQARAQAAKESLSSNRVVLEAINAGAASGGGERYKQAIRKAGQAFGFNAPETAPTEELQMGLGNAILAKARTLAPVTQEDIRGLEVTLGSINTDPGALQKMISVYNGIASKELQDFNRYVDFQTKNLQNPNARSIFSGAGIGYEMQPPPGNQSQGLAAIAELLSRGGDPTQFAVGGEQLPSDVKINVKPRGPTQGDASQPRPAGLNDAEWQELQELRKWRNGR